MALAADVPLQQGKRVVFPSGEAIVLLHFDAIRVDG
jgi:hypothetical protein